MKQNLSVVYSATNLSSFALLHRVPHPPLGHISSTNCDLHKMCSKFTYVYPFSIVAIKKHIKALVIIIAVIGFLFIASNKKRNILMTTVLV